MPQIISADNSYSKNVLWHRAQLQALLSGVDSTVGIPACRDASIPGGGASCYCSHEYPSADPLTRISMHGRLDDFRRLSSAATAGRTPAPEVGPATGYPESALRCGGSVPLRQHPQQRDNGCIQLPHRRWVAMDLYFIAHHNPFLHSCLTSIATSVGTLSTTNRFRFDLDDASELGNPSSFIGRTVWKHICKQYCTFHSGTR